MGPIVLLGGLGIGIGLLYLLGKKDAPTGDQALAMQQLEVVGKPMTGRSGKRWSVMLAEQPVGNFYQMNVLAMPQEFGPHELMPVLMYRQTGEDQSTRVLSRTYSGVPEVAIQTAIQDFGIATGPR